MSQKLADQKSLLAKLLATENITICHLQVNTASFDMKNRILTCPIWKDMDGDMYDLLMGHEVGHALFTPEIGWHDTILSSVNAKSFDAVKGADISTLKKYKKFLNIVEDARIEKLIKRKYPGIRKSFLNAYGNFLTNDMFGINKLNGDTSQLNLIDRINLHAKCGSHLIVRFTDEESELVKMVEKTETWSDVVAATNKIWEYVKENEQHKPFSQEELDQILEDIKSGKIKPEMSEDGSDDDGESQIIEIPSNEKPEKQESDKKDKNSKNQNSKNSEESDSEEESEEGDGKNSDSSDSDDSEEESEEGDGKNSVTDSDFSEDTGEDKNSTTGQTGDKGDVPSTPDSITDDAFRRNEDELVDQSAKPYIFLDLPECDLKKTIVPNNVIVKYFEETISNQMSSWKSTSHPIGLNYDSIVKTLLRDFNSNNKNYIALLVKEFEMRKNANQYARQRESKSGELDTNRLDRYRFSSDIFRKITTVEKGKSHGMIMFVDLSGSMEPVIRNTMEQALVLATFCKKVNIPFQVYGFSDSEIVYKNFKMGQEKFNPKTPTAFNVNSTFFHLKTLITSDLNSSQFMKAAGVMLMFGNLQHTDDFYSSYNSSYNRGVEYRNLFGDFLPTEDCGNMNLSGTPFIETLIASKAVINAFKTKTRADIVNVVYLTDGDGASSIQYPSMYSGVKYTQNMCNTGFTDPHTKKSVMLDLKNSNSLTIHQAAITRLIRESTGVRHIGIYVGKREIISERMREITGYNYNTKLYNTLNDSLTENNYFCHPVLGYDSYYYMAIGGKHVTDSKLGVIKTVDIDTVVNIFGEHQRNKHKNRAIAAAFIGEIASNS